MIAQLILSILLLGVLLYAGAEYRRAPLVASVAGLAGVPGLYFVWFPEQSTELAALFGIGRGVDLILYTWSCISLIVMLNLHLKLRKQLELITSLARATALANVHSPSARLAAPSVRPATAPEGADVQ